MVSYVKKIVKEAKKSSFLLSQVNAQLKNEILLRMAEELIRNKDVIFKANEKDIELAKAEKVKKSFLDRLLLNEKRIREMSSSLKEIAYLSDPLNRVIEGWQTPQGLRIKKVSVPLGVILIIYEARPNVTSDCIGLCFKTSNVVILRGGSLAINSNKAIYKCLLKVAYERLNFPPFFLVEKTDYAIVDLLLKENEYIDLVIPRGGEALIRKVTQASSIPVIKHYKGVCHIFVDEFANLEEALKICVNAKVQRPAVCNAVETILVHRKIASCFLPLLKKEFNKYKVVIKGDTSTQKILKGIKKATTRDWSKEYLDLVVSIKVVKDIDEAIEHINFYGSHHTDSIITENVENANKFVSRVDSACCFVNISTRLSDGYQFGLGAEMGISTDKLHARGPMGLKELTTYKYIVEGRYNLRE